MSPETLKALNIGTPTFTAIVDALHIAMNAVTTNASWVDNSTVFVGYPTNTAIGCIRLPTENSFLEIHLDYLDDSEATRIQPPDSKIQGPLVLAATIVRYSMCFIFMLLL